MTTAEAIARIRALGYGAEYWVPENHIFKSGIECLEAFSDAGPACGVVSTQLLARLCDALEVAERALEKFETIPSAPDPFIELAMCEMRKFGNEARAEINKILEGK